MKMEGGQDVHSEASVSEESDEGKDIEILQENSLILQHKIPLQISQER